MDGADEMQSRAEAQRRRDLNKSVLIYCPCITYHSAPLRLCARLFPHFYGMVVKCENG